MTRGQFAQFVATAQYQSEAEKDGKGSYGWDDRGRGSVKAEHTWRNPGLYGNQQTDEHPVVDMTWNDAVAFCEWLSKKESKKYRMPTEAEWEYACRAGTTTPFNFGDSLNGKQANCNGNDPYGTTAKGPYLKGTTAVGSYQANAFGLFDMHGNVMQWCGDWFKGDYYDSSPIDDPTGPADGLGRVYRGGIWLGDAKLCRSAQRGTSLPSFRGAATGFRVVLVP